MAARAEAGRGERLWRRKGPTALMGPCQSHILPSLPRHQEARRREEQLRGAGLTRGGRSDGRLSSAGREERLHQANCPAQAQPKPSSGFTLLSLVTGQEYQAREQRLLDLQEAQGLRCWARRACAVVQNLPDATTVQAQRQQRDQELLRIKEERAISRGVKVGTVEQHCFCHRA